MPLTGTDAAGRPFVVNPIGGNGIRFTSITPACQVGVSFETTDGVKADSVINGAQLNPGQGAREDAQGLCDTLYTPPKLKLGYDAARNVDPGATGTPITFAAGEEGVIYKGVMKDEPAKAIAPFRAIGSMHVVASAPPANAFLNGPAAPNQTPRWTTADMIDLSTLPNNAILAQNPAVSAMINALRWPSTSPWAIEDGDRRMMASMNVPGPDYPVRSAARDVNTAIMMMCQNISLADKDMLARCLISTGIEAYDFLNNRVSGYDFGGINGTIGLGGVAQRGFKQAVGVAGLLLNDLDMQTMAGTNQYSLNGQCVYVTQAHIDATQVEDRPDRASKVRQYQQVDLGTPEVFISNHYKGWMGDRGVGQSYRSTVSCHVIRSALAAHVFPGLRDVMNLPQMFDYADRVMERDFHADSADANSVYQLARNNSWGDDNLSAWEVAAWDAWRTLPGNSAIWDWA